MSDRSGLRLNASAQAQEPEDKQDDYHKTDDINDLVHLISCSVLTACHQHSGETGRKAPAGVLC